jgi:hypothetical protein
MTGESSYVTARRVLLDALEALGAQRAAVVLCGAQAVYFHVGEDDFAVSPFTIDADLMLAPALLVDEPLLRVAMESAGFRLADPPGIWRSHDDVEVDLLVPEALGGAGRRAAKLGPPHGNEVSRKVRGLEAVAVDNSTVKVRALDERDKRVFEIAVAGPAALLVAKLHKVADRADQPAGRVKDKDGLDILRLLRAVPSDRLAADIVMLMNNSLSRDVTKEAISILREFFGTRAGEGTQMAVRATQLLEDPDQIAASCAALSADLVMRIEELLRSEPTNVSDA